MWVSFQFVCLSGNSTSNIIIWNDLFFVILKKNIEENPIDKKV